jgi:hypothetical protein
MQIVRALLIFMFCQYDDYRTVGKNGARQHPSEHHHVR